MGGERGMCVCELDVGLDSYALLRTHITATSSEDSRWYTPPYPIQPHHSGTFGSPRRDRRKTAVLNHGTVKVPMLG